MKVTVNIDCTPEEARAFMGLPDVTPLNEQLVAEMQKRMDPEEAMKSWWAMGGQAQEQFMKMMTSAAGQK